MQEAGEAADPGTDDPEEVVDGAEEVAADQEEARHVHVQEESGVGKDFQIRLQGTHLVGENLPLT